MSDESGELPAPLSQFSLNLNTICNWREATGRRIEECDFNNEIDVRMLIFCGLKDEVENFTLKDAGRLITSYNKAATHAFLKRVLLGEVTGRKN
jgi:hypothetical protein